MRAVVDAKDFSKALDRVSKVLKKSQIPILGEAMVRFSDGRCILTGTDFETWLTTEIPAQGDDFAFVFHRTASAVKACRRFQDELVLELTETGNGRSKGLCLCLRNGCRTGEFQAFSPEEYPKLPKLEAVHIFTTNAASLLARVNRIGYATYRTSQNGDVRGSCVQFTGNRIFCLDGVRAAWDTDEALSVPIPFMVPATSLEYLKVFGTTDISIYLGERYLSISDGTTCLQCRRAESVLFDLDSAIPRHFYEEVSLCPDEFLAELAYLKELVPGNLKYTVRFCGGKLLAQADGCRYQTEIQLDGRSVMEVGFDLRHMADALRQFKGEPRVRMKLTTPISPIVLEAEGRNDCAMVLPVRLKQAMAA